VNEAEWLARTEPEPMLWHLKGKAPTRKFWSFTAAACVRATAFLPREVLQVVSGISEQLAAGEAGPEERRSARQVTALWKERFVTEQDFERAVALRELERCVDSPGRMAFASAKGACHFAWLTAGWAGQSDEPQELQDSERAAAARNYRHHLADLLRCIFGNPFRPMPSINPALLAWKDGTMPQLAYSAAYEDRRLPDGTLDPARLALLADALEDTGCTDADLLGHLRSPGPHVRGCWAVDLLLTRS
jgi:hypothetical protein